MKKPVARIIEVGDLVEDVRLGILAADDRNVFRVHHVTQLVLVKSPDAEPFTQRVEGLVEDHVLEGLWEQNTLSGQMENDFS